MRRFRLDSRLGFVGLVVLASAGACTPAFDTARAPSPKATVGEEVYGVLCDRVGGQALPEDLTGASYKGVCHKTASGTWSSTVDESSLPPITAGLKTASGEPVSVATAQASRSHGVARIQALAGKRADLIVALDATFPETLLPIKDINNPNAALTCNPAPNDAKDPLPSQLAALLGRFTKLYDDGTIPASTESFARVMTAFNAQPDAQAAYARLNSRQGYRPLDVALGVVRPMLAYPELRDFTNATLNLLSSAGNAYATPQEPGAAYPELQAMLAAAYEELRTTTVGTPLGVETVGTIDTVGRAVLSRPWDNLEFMQQIFYAQDPTFGGGASQYIVQRDYRGYALVPLGTGGVIPFPFEDKNGDGLADVNASGQFVTVDGKPAPTPFFSFDGPAAPARDSYGRAMTSETGSLYYGYLDTSHVYASSLMNDMKAFADPVPADAHETLMNAIAGAYVLLGTRTPATKTYPADPSLAAEWSLTHGLASAPSSVGTTPVKLAYNGYDGSSSPMLDLVYGLGNVLADRTNDDMLAYSNALLAQDPTMVARLVGTGLAMQANAKSHPEAHIPAKSTFWDEMIDVTIQIEQEPGLLEDILTALGNDNSLLIPSAFGAYNHYNDAITYDPNNLNGPPLNLTTGSNAPPSTPVNRSMADTGTNRSEFQRFTELIHDTNGLTVCNKANAEVDADVDGVTLQLPYTIVWGFNAFPECAVFKIDNAAIFYLDSIIGKANLYLRDDTLRSGVDIPLVGDVGAATVGLMEDSSGINGFWDDSGSETLRPMPQFLDRQLFYDQSDPSNPTTQQFLSDLVGPKTGTMVCPERIITDPCASSSSNCSDAPDIASDGLVHGLRSCPDGQWLIQRDPNTIFVWEDESFYQAMTPVITAFANHNREDLFISLMETLDRHWADNRGSASECLLSVDPSVKYKNCTGDGVVTYEPLLVEQYTSDLIPAMHDLVAILQTLTIPHCDSIDPTTHSCTPTPVNGISVMANTLRSVFDPNLAAAAGLKDRHGKVTGLRNDGTTNPQVTRLYLILEALNGIDAAFADYAAKNPKDATRQTAWLSARSQIVDQLFTINGSGTGSSFADPTVPKILPVVINAIRSQLVAHCASSFNAPYPPCAWAGQDLASHLEETVTGPLFGGTMDLTDAIRRDTTGRQSLEQLLTYLLDAASGNQARAIVLGAADDILQALSDDQDLVPLYHVLAEAARPSVATSTGVVVQKGVADAQMGLLSRIAGRAMTVDGGKVVEDCSPKATPLAEIDPNQVLTVALSNLVTPMKTGDKAGETPLEVMLDTIDAVNRAAPAVSASLDSLSAADYQSISQNLDEFLLDKQRGLEQFYEVVRLGTE